MNIVIQSVGLIGTIAFAISGALTALKKHMDMFGVVMLGLVTAVGGGVIRDIILGLTPPTVFQTPFHAIIAIITSVIVFLVVLKMEHASVEDGIEMKRFDRLLLIMDSLGLGIFTVIGIQTAYAISEEFNMSLLLFVGVITGTGGGVLRDVFSNDMPYIFKKHIYAVASLIGALITIMLWKVAGSSVSMLAGAGIIVLIRLLAAKYCWSLPKLKK